MPKVSGVPTYVIEDFVYYTEPRKRVRGVTVVLAPGYPASTTARVGGEPLALRRLLGGTELRIHNTEAGHLIALEYGGPDVESNLVPMWGHFNKHGAWKQLEASIATLVATRGRVNLEITCDYLASTDARIPKVFRVKATLLESVGSPAMWTINHVPPRPRPEAPDMGFAALVATARTDMNTVFPNGFFIEETYTRTRSGQQLKLPGRTVAERPYAILDYMALSSSINFPLLANVDNHRGFDEQQRAWILALNRMDNNDLLITDDAADFATTATDLHRDSRGNHIYHGSYIADGFPLGVLMETGGDQAPEVDHIIPESRGGSNAFSNAQVISRAYNQWKHARISDDDAQRLEALSRRSSRLSSSSGSGSKL
ncbi:MAG TPA: DNA/RNA non-specific endonuclease [Longimicrobium sp.]|nr:DNA/RNA non-specific endonuclease [Longimicrobium sp.]